MTVHACDLRADTGSRGTNDVWFGRIAFAGSIMMMLGFFHALAGLVALLRDDYFLVANNGLVVTADYTTWGWTHLILGAIVAAAGGAVLAGKTWARVAAVLVALSSAVVNLAFLSAFPLGAAIMIAIDVVVIYAVTAHGRPADELR